MTYDVDEKGRFKKGIIPWNKGKTNVYPIATRQKMSIARTGIKSPNLPSPRVCIKCGLVCHSEEFVNPNRGRICKDCNKTKFKLYRKTNSERIKQCQEKSRIHRVDYINNWYRQHNQSNRIKILKHYSPTLTCQKCGFSDIRALTIDHINGGGIKHRNLISKHRNSAGFYKWIITNDYPTGFQILCSNCQSIKRYENKENIVIVSPEYELTKKVTSSSNDWSRNRRQKLRINVIEHYSPNRKCQTPNCECSDLRALTIDHINGNGRKHMREIAVTGRNYYNWIIKNGYPPMFRILCSNCQSIKKWENKEGIKIDFKEAIK